MTETAPSARSRASPALAGEVRLRPATGLPAITSSRPELAPRLAPGRRADALPDLLAALHSLCAPAHRLTARRAVAAARGQADPPADPNAAGSAAGDAQALRLATARDQVLRLVHDWPRQLPGATPPGLSDSARDAASALLLRACPLWRSDGVAEERLAALPEWLAHHLLGQPVRHWLAAHEAAPATWAATWATHRAFERAAAPAPPWLAPLLASQIASAAPADALATPPRSAALLDGSEGDIAERMARIAQALASEPGFWIAPQLGDHIPDSGPWNRRHDPLRQPAAATAAAAAPTAWSRLVARVVDLLRLAEPGGAGWLDRGALSLNGHAGIAWTEMARGLLIHWVQLDDSGQTVQACRVLAPTEWNFHPRGVLAQALAALADRPADERRIAAQRLAVAFDPCVAFSIELPDEEVAHA